MTLSQAFKWMERVQGNSLEEELREFNEIMQRVEHGEIESEPETEEEEQE